MNPLTAKSRHHLSEQQLNTYWEDGFLFPVQVFSSEQAQNYRVELEQIEQTWKEADLPNPVAQYLRSHSECVMPFAAKMATCPAVLDAVESMLGPNLMIWGAEFFIKEAHTEAFVSMHQDLTYWGFGETSDQVTAWIALSPSTVESGCMDLVKGSHKNHLLAHSDTHAANNLLSRGQEVDVKVADNDKTHVVLQPGEMSLHHGQCIHGSGPNLSDDRRIGFAIRYINSKAKQQAGHREYVMLARGIDKTDKFIHHAAPAADFSAASLSIHEEIVAQQKKVLGAGMESGKQLYNQPQ